MRYFFRFQAPFAVRSGGDFFGCATFQFSEDLLRQALALIERERTIDELKAENETLRREADRLQGIQK